MANLVAGCPLRIQWGRPRPLGNLDRSQASQIGREARAAISTGNAANSPDLQTSEKESTVDLESLIVPPPTDDGPDKYPSQMTT